MGDVLLVYKLYPREQGEEDIIAEKVREVLKGKGEVAEVRIEPLAFGYNVVRVGIKVKDEEGAQNRVEEALNSIEEADNIELEVATLI